MYLRNSGTITVAVPRLNFLHIASVLQGSDGNTVEMSEKRRKRRETKKGNKKKNDRKI